MADEKWDFFFAGATDQTPHPSLACLTMHVILKMGSSFDFDRWRDGGSERPTRPGDDIEFEHAMQIELMFLHVTSVGWITLIQHRAVKPATLCTLIVFTSFWIDFIFRTSLIAWTDQFDCLNRDKARTYLQLTLQQWGAGNVYLLVLSSWKVNIAENPIAVMGL